MIEVIQAVAALIVTLSILVTFHEYGHYAVARLCGVHVLRFSLGFGKPIFTWRRTPGGTEFVVAAIPLGGYVKMLDEREAEVPEALLPLTFNRKSVWQRIAIVIAGPFANFLLAILAYWLLFTVGVTGLIPVLGDLGAESPAARAGLVKGQEIVAVDGKATPTWSQVNQQLLMHLGDTGSILITAKDARRGSTLTSDHAIGIVDWLKDAEQPSPTRDLGLVPRYPPIPAVIGEVTDEGRARLAGLVPGDKIMTADGVPVSGWQSLVKQIQSSPELPITLGVLRSGAAAGKPDTYLTLELTPEARALGGEEVGYIGVAVATFPIPEEMQREVSLPVYRAWLPAIEKTWQLTAFTYKAIGKMLVGALSPKHLSGPITIARIANDTAEAGLESFIGFIALLSISLGVLNLLPIPVLDGGHLMYYFVEVIRGKPVSETVQAWGMQLGMVLIVGLMILAFYNDLIRLT